MEDYPRNKQGVIDLNKCIPVRRPVVQVKQVVVSDDIKQIHDLIYDNNEEIREAILGRYPEARLTGDWDEIHEDRLSVEGVSTTRLAWYRFLIAEGLASISLVFQMAMYQDRPTIEKAMDAECPGWRDKKVRRGASR